LTNPAGGSTESQTREDNGLIDRRVNGGHRDDPTSILLVDDDIPLCASLAALLRLAGYRVVEAHTGADALSLIDGRTFDVAIIDVALPDTDGITLLKDLVSRDGDIGALMLSGRASLSDAADAMRHGADAFMLKPLDPEELVAHVERVARAKRLERGLRASEAMYRELFENHGEGVFYSDTRGNFISMNQAGADILGYGDPDELTGGVGRDWMSFTGDEYEALRITAYGMGEAVSDIMRFRRRDGNLGWIEMTLRARRDHRGEALGLVGTFKDVSHRVRSQEMHEAVYGLWADLGEVDSLEEVGEIALGFLSTNLGVDRGRLSVVEGEMIKPVGAHHPYDSRHEFGHSLTLKAVKTGRAYLYPDPGQGSRRGLDPSGDHAQLAVPIKMEGGVVGVIHLSKAERAPFTDEDIKLVETVSDQVAMALDRLIRSKIGLSKGLSLEDFL